MKNFFRSVLCVFIILVIKDAYEKNPVIIQSPSGEIAVPRKDARRLEYLFRNLIVYKEAGYTLLGNKPVSFDVFLKPCFEKDWLFLWHAFLPSNLKKYYAWTTWKQYEHLFNKKNIRIWSQPHPKIKHQELIVVVNQRTLEKMFQENRQDFTLLPKDDLQALFCHIIEHHEGLFGLLLGYGRSNAWLFYEKKNFLLKPVFSQEIKELLKNKKATLNFTLGWPNVPMKEILMFPNFMADIDAEETKKIKLDYLNTRQKILDYYENKNFLEATLQAL